MQFCCIVEYTYQFGSITLRFYYHHCANVDGVIKLARFPIRHPNASVRCRHPRQITLVQAVTGRELDKVGHRRANEVRMWRFAVTSAIHVGLHDAARAINIVTIKTGAMIFVLTGDLKSANRSSIPFATTGYARRRRSIPCAVEIGFLCPQAYNDRRTTGM